MLFYVVVGQVDGSSEQWSVWFDGNRSKNCRTAKLRW